MCRLTVSVIRASRSEENPTSSGLATWIDAAARGPVSRAKTGATNQSFFMNAPPSLALSYRSRSSAARAADVGKLRELILGQSGRAAALPLPAPGTGQGNGDSK